ALWNCLLADHPRGGGDHRRRCGSCRVPGGSWVRAYDPRDGQLRQHYGLVRADGAPIEMRHAWDCYRLISNSLQYNLSRHADHHMFASKPFWELDAAADSPKLPHGYQMMSLIALCPSAWHKAVDPLLADWDSRLANDDERSLVQERG